MDSMFTGLEEARVEILRLREQIATLDQDEELFSERLQDAKEDRAMATQNRTLRMDTKEGYLVKQGADKWKRRYFVVDRTCLTYFEDDVRTGAPKGAYFLSPATIVMVGDEQNNLREVVPAGVAGTASQVKAMVAAEKEASERAAAPQKRALNSGLDKVARSSTRMTIARTKSNNQMVLPPPSGPPPAILPPPSGPPPAAGSILPPPSLPAPRAIKSIASSPRMMKTAASSPRMMKTVGSSRQLVNSGSNGQLVNGGSASMTNILKAKKLARPPCPPRLEPFSFSLVTNGIVLKLACENARELKHWTTTLEERITSLQSATRGYLKVDKGKWANVDGAMFQRCVLRGGEWKQFHFLLEPECLHAFKDQSMVKSKGVFAFEEGCSINTNIEVGGNTKNRIFALVSSKESTYFEAENDEEYNMWCKKVGEAVDEVPNLLAKQMAEQDNIRKASKGMTALHSKTNKRQQRRGSIRDVGVDMEEGTKAEDIGTKKGKLLKLPTKGNFISHNTKKGGWKERFCSLDGYDGTFTYFDDGVDSEPKGSFSLNQHCIVKQTKVCPFAFDVVTPGRVVVLAAHSQEAYDAWVLAIRAAIEVQAARQSTLDVLEQAAVALKDEFYSITYEEKVATLGFQVNRRREWMCITKSDHSSISDGSVIHAVNGEVMVGQVYKTVLARLKGWEPPLTLTLRPQVRVCYETLFSLHF
jgi:hypothetical protein